MPAPFGPCAWVANHTGHSATDLAEWTALPANIQAVANDVACRTLWAALGKRFDACPRTVRPILACTHRSMADLDGSCDEMTYMGDQEWLTYPTGGPCCLQVNPKIAALEPPVNTITQVMVDGVVVAPAAYRVDESSYLTRIDGNSWPTWQNLATANNAVGAFTVEYTIGIPIPAVALQMAGTLALELARGMTGSSTCRLPSRVTEIIRQGTTVSLTDPEWIMEHGMTGIPEVDFVIRAYNPLGQTAPYTAWIPNHYPTVVGA